jgi:hypothetical protein
LTNFVSAIVHAIGHGEVHHFFKSLCLKKIKEKLSAMSDLSWHMKGGATQSYTLSAGICTTSIGY